MEFSSRFRRGAQGRTTQRSVFLWNPDFSNTNGFKKLGNSRNVQGGIAVLLVSVIRGGLESESSTNSGSTVH